MTGRPREFDSDQALDAAMEYFWSNGYESASLQGLLKAMNLSKSSFYQTFGSKHKLFQSCINRYQTEMAANMLKKLNQADSGLKFIEETFYAAAKETEPMSQCRGCFTWNSASEFGQRDPAIAALIAKGIDGFTHVFRCAVERAQQEKDISTEKDQEALAHFLVTNMSGLKTLIKSGATKSTVNKVVSVILTTLK